MALNPDVSVSVPSAQSEYRSDSLIPARSLASACAWGSRNATHVAATALTHPLINPARVLPEGGHQMLGLCEPLQGPHREGCHSHTKLYSIQVFHPSQNSKFSFLPLFYRTIIEIVLPPLSYKRLTPSEQMGICSPLSIFLF